MYETEEQQVEAIKKWWDENGKSIVAGVVIGLGGVLGWQAWTNYSANVAAQASNVFDQLVVSVSNSDAAAAEKQAQMLHADFGSTPYSAFAELMQARVRYEQSDVDGAKTALKQAMDKAPNAGIRTIAVMRLARLHIGTGELDQAAALLDKYPVSTAFSADYAVLRGDLARARGDHAAARSAYQEAIAGSAGNLELVKLKLENLPSTPAS